LRAGIPGDSGVLVVTRWIASLSLSSGAHSRDPLARNDVAGGFLKIEVM
jgi:hypothetical protein